VPGDSDIKAKLLKGVNLNGRKYKNYIDGYNQLDYFTGKSKESPRNEFMYVNDDGQVGLSAIKIGK
jgi:arylsulfatase